MLRAIAFALAAAFATAAQAACPVVVTGPLDPANIISTLNTALTQGSCPVQGKTASPRNIHTCAKPPDTTTSGTDTTPVATETYIAEVFIPTTVTVTGVAVLNGSAVAGNMGVALADSTGTVVASTAAAGVASSGTAAYQRVPFSATYVAAGPATYYVLLQNNNTSNRFRSQAAPGNCGASKKTGETFGTWTTITPPTTFTADLGVVATLY